MWQLWFSFFLHNSLFVIFNYFNIMLFQAEKAGHMSRKQLVISSRMGDVLLQTKSRLFLAFSFLQQGKLSQAKKLIKLVVSSTKVNDTCCCVYSFEWAWSLRFEFRMWNYGYITYCDVCSGIWVIYMSYRCLCFLVKCVWRNVLLMPAVLVFLVIASVFFCKSWLKFWVQMFIPIKESHSAVGFTVHTLVRFFFSCIIWHF